MSRPVDHPEVYRFFRPILWEIDDPYYQYSMGGTANIVRLCGRDFIVTANHCFDRDPKYYPFDKVRIPFRLGCQSYCGVGKGVGFSVADPTEEHTIHTDVRIHLLEVSSAPEPPLEPGEYLEIHAFQPSSHFLPRFLSGFPHERQEIDFDNKELRGDGMTLQGSDRGPTNDAGCRFFVSPELESADANGYSGGLVTSDVLGDVQLEGLCLQGRAKEIDFIRFVSVEVLGVMFDLAWRKLVDAPGQATGSTPSPPQSKNETQEDQSRTKDE